MEMMGVPVLSVEVVVHSGEDHRTRGGTGSGGGEGLGETNTFFGQGIEMRSLDDGVPVAAGDWRLVVSDEEDDVGLFGRRDERRGD